MSRIDRIVETEQTEGSVESLAMEDLSREMQKPLSREPIVDVEHGQMVPKNFEGIWRLASMYQKSGLAPRGMETAHKLAIAIAHGGEIGLSPMQSIQCIAPINGRPSIYGDAALGLVEASGKQEDFLEEEIGNKGDDSWGYRCVTKRAGRKSQTEYTFTVADAKRAKLWGKPGPWTDYTKRMLQFRARGFCLRDTYPDVLKGLILAEEASDLPETLAAIASPSIADRLKTIEKKNGNGHKPAAPVIDSDAHALPPEEPVIQQEEPATVANNDFIDPKSFEAFKISLWEMAQELGSSEADFNGAIQAWLLRLGKKRKEEETTPEQRKALSDALAGKAGYFSYLGKEAGTAKR